MRLLAGGLFAGDDSFAGANRSASAAIDAGVGIDVVDVAFRDSANGALGKTCAASYAFVGDYVCHGYENKIVESWIKTITGVRDADGRHMTLQK